MPRLVDGAGRSGSPVPPVGTGLALLAIAEVLAIRDPAWPPLANLGAVAVGLVVLWHLGRRRARRARPDGTSPASPGAGAGWAAVAVFVLAPALLLGSFGGQPGEALRVVLVNVAALLLVAVLRGGAWPVVRWMARNVGRQFRASLRLFSRALPLLLISTTFLFLTAEVWQAIGTLPGPALATLLLLFVGLAVAFLMARLPAELGRLTTFASPSEVVQLCRGTPVASASTRLARLNVRRSRLRRAERVNVGALVAAAVLTQVALVSLLVGGFFVCFGTVVVSPAVAEAWIGGQDPTVLLAIALPGRQAAVTESLVRVSAFLAAFTSLYFAVSIIEDSNYHREFFDTIVADVRRALAVRLVYRTLRDRPSSHARGRGQPEGASAPPSPDARAGATT
jgi:hypothetical protein